jgi:hypothetical protein
MVICPTNLKDEGLFEYLVQVDRLYYDWGHVGIKVNDKIGPYYQTQRG